jgi:hypothetical protein
VGGREEDQPGAHVHGLQNERGHVPAGGQVGPGRLQRLPVEEGGRQGRGVDVDGERDGGVRIAPAQHHTTAAGRHLAMAVLFQHQPAGLLAEAVERVEPLFVGHGCAPGT